MQGRDLVETFKTKLEQCYLSEGAAPFCWVMAGTVSSYSALSSPGPPAHTRVGRCGEQGAGQHQHGPLFPPLSSPSQERKHPLLPAMGIAHLLSPTAETFPSPLAEGWVLPGRHLRLQGGAGPSPCPLLWGPWLEPPSSLHCECKEGGTRSRGR